MGFALGPKAKDTGYRLAEYETIGSTSAEALARGRAGDAGKLWIVAGEQTAGHGRRGRPWQTPAGNLAASLLLRMPEPSASLGFAAGLALVSAIETVANAPVSPDLHRPLPWRERVPVALAQAAGEGEITSIAPAPLTRPSADAEGHPLPQGERGRQLRPPAHHLRLKWPNDVLINDAKVAGLLLEASTIPGGSVFVVVGFGVNVCHSPHGLSYATTSLAAEGIDVTAEQLFAALSDGWVEHEILWNGGRGFGAIRELWLQHAAGVGAPITVSTGEATVSGTFETIDDGGQLVVRARDGRAHRISAGDVHFGAAATVSG